MLESFTTDKFTYKRLSPEEQKERGILGRLVGIIADTKNATRNGRKYSMDLWKHVFDDPVMKEKIANRCVFSELGHPADREEIDMEKVCACLAEQPKVGEDGKLYGVFDILDTNNGRILKTLCDYGTTVGISSRGTGDLYTDDLGEEAVDPDTYNCECFDIVIVPAVESARLQYVTEALDTKKYNKTLKEKISEQLEKASDKDRKAMEESLQVLDETFKVVGKDLKGNVIHNYRVDSKEEAEELKKDIENNVELTAGVHPTETVDVIQESLNEEIDMQKEIAEEQREDQVGVFSQGLKPGTELRTQSGHRIKIRDINVKFVDGKPEVYFKYDFITNRGKQGSGTNDSAGFYKLLSEDVEMPEGEALVEEVVNEAPNVKIEQELQRMTAELANIYIDAGLGVDEVLDNVRFGCSAAGVNPYEVIKAMYEDAQEYMDFHTDFEANESICESDEVNNLDIDIKEAEKILDVFKREERLYDNAPKVLNDKINDGVYFIEVDNSNPTYISSLENSLHDLEKLGIGFDSEKNDNGFYGRTYTFYKLGKDESISESCGDKEVKEKKVDNVKDDSELQEMLLRNSELEKDNLALQEKLSVCNAKAIKIEEELNRYRDGMAQLSDTAKEAKALKESLDKKTKVIESSRSRVENLIESKKKAVAEAKALNESIEELTSKVESLSKELTESKETIKKYKKALTESKNKYLEAKADAIGVRKEEIVQNLHESYSYKNIDSVCNELVEQKKTLNKLPFKLNENARISVTGKKDYIERRIDDDDDISSLLKLL